MTKLHLSIVAALTPWTVSIVPAQTIVCPPDAPARVKLAAKEIRRYAYLRSGTLLPIAATGRGLALQVDPSLETQEYRLKSGGDTLAITGGSDVAVLYGAYAFAEKLGVRFYLHGDVIPDEKIPFALPQLDETHQPLFALRGVNPWGSHPFGFDAWSADDYQAVFTQLAKMRMNFLGIHCYPEGHPYAEPTVWHGLTGDFDAAGRVARSYVSRYFNTMLKPGWGDYRPKQTGDYSFGGALLFDDEAWAPPVLRGHCPLPETSDDCNEVFNRMGAQFNAAFAFARQLGVKTCIGTEAPLTIPKAVRERLQAQGKNPADPAVVREIYEGTFRRIMASQPLDYYWLWTPESWTWQGNQPVQYSNTVADINLASEALRQVNAPFQLATAGWVLGPAHDRAAFDRDLPKNIPMSAISRNTGATEVDPAFGRIAGREKWAIPWLESDNRQGLAGVQLEAGRMRRDAVDAREYHCTGLMGLHWRTEIISPNISALAQAAWDQSFAKDWQADPGTPRSLPCDDFYADWARANFGLAEAGQVFAAIDGNVPLAAQDDCPAGNITADATPWPQVAARYGFVDQLAGFRPRIRGAGNLDRFDYWLNMFKYYRALAQTRCAMGANQPDEVLRAWTEASTCLLGTVNSPGGLAMVVNMENKPGTGPLVAKAAGKPFPKDYLGPPRLIVPTVRSVVNRGAALSLKIIALDRQPVKSVTVHVSPLGKGEWQTLAATHVARAVYAATLPAAPDDFEYYISAETVAGQKLGWPATAPELNQTVVVTD